MATPLRFCPAHPPMQMVKENEKQRALEQEMQAMGDDQRVIVFANTKRQVWCGCGCGWGEGDRGVIG